MSVSASIDLEIIQNNSVLTPVKIIHLLLDAGWSLQRKNGYICYLPLGDNDGFNWMNGIIDMKLFMQFLEKKEQKNELIGIFITWKNTDIGGDILLRTEVRMQETKINMPVSFNLNSNRQTLIDKGLNKITDFNWYLIKLLPAFNKENICVNHFICEEHV